MLNNMWDFCQGVGGVLVILGVLIFLGFLIHGAWECAVEFVCETYFKKRSEDERKIFMKFLHDNVEKDMRVIDEGTSQSQAITSWLHMQDHNYWMKLKGYHHESEEDQD